MDDLSAFFPLIAVILGVLVAIGFVWLATKAMWKVAEPNEALIISGLTRGTLENTDGMDFKIVTGKGALVIPGLQTVRPLALTLNETELKVSCVTSQGIQVIVDGVVIYKIGDAPPFIANAARRFLGQQPKMESQVYNVFEGHLRSIIGAPEDKAGERSRRIVLQADLIVRDSCCAKTGVPRRPMRATAQPSA